MSCRIEDGRGDQGDSITREVSINSGGRHLLLNDDSEKAPP